MAVLEYCQCSNLGLRHPSIRPICKTFRVEWRTLRRAIVLPELLNENNSFPRVGIEPITVALTAKCYHPPPRNHHTYNMVII